MEHGDDLRGSLERLVRLGRTPEVDIRPVLLRVLVDMFVRKAIHAPSDLAQFEEMIQHLLDDADAEVRQVVAEKLARHPATPRRLLDRFLSEGGDVAAPVLGLAAVTHDALGTAAAWGSASMALAVAARSDLDVAIVGMLVERPEPDVLLTVAQNLSAPLETATFRYLVRRARGDADLGRALLLRDGPAIDCAPLFLLANSEQRAAIVLAARREELSPDTYRPRLTADEAEALTRVERTILSPDRDGFDTALAAALGVRLDDAWQLIDDVKGEPLALALAAIGASEELAARVFILSGPAIGHSVMAVRRLTALVKGIPRTAAARLIAAMTHAATRALRQPGPEGERTRRRQSTDDGRSVARLRTERSPAVDQSARKTSGA